MKNRKSLRLVSIALVLAMLFTCLAACSAKPQPQPQPGPDDNNQGGSTIVLPGENQQTTPEPEKPAESFTLMVYLCGSNLESQWGCATTDLNEMIYAGTGEKLNIVVQTGGAKKWQNSVIGKSVQRYSLNGDGIDLLEDKGMVKFTDPELLGDFIKFSAEKYPADRYGIIFWDHGGGTTGGYGSDENFGNEGMTIAEVAKGLRLGGTHFDFIGYDCCLMATVENANAIAPYGDYMVASEETEPGSGWYYTNFLKLIEEDPDADIKRIARSIINDYNSSEFTDVRGGVTLSLVDLKKVPDIITNLYFYMENAEEYLKNGNGYGELAGARQSARSYGGGDFEQIDMIDYIDKTSVNGGAALAQSIKDAVILNGTNMQGSNGLAMYYPYEMTEYYGYFSEITESAGMVDDSYTSYFNDFVSIMNAGYMNGGNYNPFAGQEDEDYSYITDSDWFNEELAGEYDYYYVDGDELEIYEKDDYYVLSLSEEDWDIVTDIELQVYVDDGEGYLALGSDDMYEFDDDGDLVVDFDYTWIYIDDCIVPYYVFEQGEYSDGSYYGLGYCPALLNDDENINIWIYFDNDGGTCVLGYTPESQVGVSSKGYYWFEEGDVIDFWFDYYDYDGNYMDAYTLEDNYIVVGSDTEFEVHYDEIGEVDTEICFYLQDIYNNSYWTEPLFFYY